MELTGKDTKYNCTQRFCGTNASGISDKYCPMLMSCNQFPKTDK